MLTTFCKKKVSQNEFFQRVFGCCDMNKMLLILLTSVITLRAYSQSCCSGGVPISSNIGLPLASKNTWQVSVSYDLNLLNTLQDGRNKLNNNTRKRITHTALTQIGYSLNDRISFDALIPYVRQEREISPIGLASTFSSTQGLGDIVLLGKIRVIKKYQIGFGLKLPNGSTNEQEGIFTLSADLQPGSGSWDVIYWLSGQENLKWRKSTTVSI